MHWRTTPQYLKILIQSTNQKHDNMRSNNKGTTLATPKVKHKIFAPHSQVLSTLALELPTPEHKGITKHSYLQTKVKTLQYRMAFKQ